MIDIVKKITYWVMFEFQWWWVNSHPGQMIPNKKVRELLKGIWNWSRERIEA